jgi:hypothetical protein
MHKLTLISLEKAKPLLHSKKGLLTLLAILGHVENKGVHFAAVCECGNFTSFYTKSCYNKKNSCGCLKIKNAPKGSEKWNTKISENDLIVSLKLYRDGIYSLNEVCAILKKKSKQISYLLKGNIWKHVNISQKNKTELLKKIKQDSLNERQKNLKIRSENGNPYQKHLNKKFGSNTLIAILPEKNSSGKTRGLFRCDCGNERGARIDEIIRCSKTRYVQCRKCVQSGTKESGIILKKTLFSGDIHESWTYQKVE